MSTINGLPDEFADIDESLLDSVSGADAAKEEADKSGGGGFGRRWVYLDQLVKADAASQAQGKDRVYLRYLTDYQADKDSGVLAWITAQVHTAVSTKNKPASWPADRSWPKKLSCVCRKSTLVSRVTGGVCWVCDNVEDDYKEGKPHSNPPRTFAVAVLREPIIGDGSEEMGGPKKKGQKIGFTDVTVEVPVLDENGELTKDENDQVITETAPQYVIVRQAYSNYFQALRSLAQEYGTALDRDYLVIREGEKKDTTYTHVSMNPMRFVDEGKEIDYDMRDADLREVFYGDMPSLIKVITEQASLEFYNKWYIPQDGDDDAGDSGSGGKAVAAPASKPREHSQSKVDEMKARLRARQSGAKA